MCPIASSKLGTTRTARMRSRYSVSQSASVAGRVPGTSSHVRGQPRSSTPAAREARGDRGQERGRGVRVDQERLERVAHARALGLRVDRDVGRHVEVGPGVDVDVAEPLVVLEHRDRGALGHQADELLPAARDDEVDVPVEREQDLDGLAVGHVDEPERLGREPGLLEALGEDRRDDRVRLERLAAAAQHAPRCPILRQSAAASAVTFGRRLVDEPDHAERHADPRDLDPVRPPPAADRLARRDPAARRPGGAPPPSPRCAPR